MRAVQHKTPRGARAAAVAGLAVLAGCSSVSKPPRPPLSAATGAALTSCAGLATRLAFPNTTITAANPIAAGTLKVAGSPVPAHCQVLGQMNARVGPIDGKPYAIGFEMRLPEAWNGRFFYQANGGLDGAVAPATGAVDGGAGLTNALALGFAVISSDAGHAGSLGPFFGLDPQARLDYGYQAAATLTPMAKRVIQTAYGKGPDRSYFGGCSNGGRHTMVAAARMPDEYDGYLVGDPGWRLPRAAIANIAGAQAYATLATKPGDLSSGFTQAERTLVSNAVLARCDALDGAADGLVQDTATCQRAFALDRDVPTCTGARDGSCLSAEQKSVISRLFAGATTRAGAPIYASWPFDAGIAAPDWASWKFTAPTTRDTGAVAFIFQVPPESPAGFDGRRFALEGDVDAMLAKVHATNATYREAAMSFMVPPRASELGALRQRGAKMMLYHGTSDPIFSIDDSAAWYDALRAAQGGDASDFVRFFPVPGMNHCRAGPATDQFDMLTPLVDWVEKGVAPARVIAGARGPGNAGGVNADVPPAWSPTRTRPLCPYPQVARYSGSGSLESADSFVCRAP
jgi:feruloyl esterase